MNIRNLFKRKKKQEELHVAAIEKEELNLKEKVDFLFEQRINEEVAKRTALAYQTVTEEPLDEDYAGILKDQYIQEMAQKKAQEEELIRLEKECKSSVAQSELPHNEIAVETDYPEEVAEDDSVNQYSTHQNKKEEASRPLDKKEKRQVAKRLKKQRKAQAKSNRKKRLPKTSQQTIAYQQMNKNGLCQIAEGTYSITLEYHDINYQLAKPEDKEAIFDQYCQFLNQFDSSISVQLSFVNKATKCDDVKHHLSIKASNDGYDAFRKEYNEILLQQVSHGKSNIEKTKYVTLTIKADSKEAAMQKLARIEVEAKSSLKALGSPVDSLDGYDRLKLLHDILNQKGQEFWFNWDLISKTGLSTKDFIAPESFDFRDKRTFRVGETYGAVSFLQIMASELSDEILARLLDTDSSTLVTMHLHSVDQNAAMKQVKRKLSDLEKNKIEEQRKAVKAGYDMGATRSLITA